ncbi:11059_t:CDS:2 [Dentiscutata heterogama]|uniref:11059_t:CDS:1 n=1 Tax=Dentiscutata heterogama TaxID=1316150 RepID=A0ACA9KDU0_9GLOM|nr:11059_t:CDS:2 [Dentiscutata heterogama]
MYIVFLCVRIKVEETRSTGIGEKGFTKLSNGANSNYQQLSKYLSVPSTFNAIRQTIQRVHHLDLPTELLTLDSFVILDHMKQTLKGSDFLISDTTVNQSRILIFTTANNIRHLNHSPYWIMDGIFKIVLNIFKQLYTIHGCIGSNENSRIMPLVFSLITEKSMEFYRRLFQGLIDFAKEHDVTLSPQIVLTDFEDFSILIRHISVLAFLPHSEIPAMFDKLKVHILVEARDIVQWFEDNYVHGRVKHVHRNGTLVRSEPSFPPNFWSVSENVEFTYPRTQNVVEELQKEQNKVEVSIEVILRGAPRPPLRRQAIERELRIHSVYNDCNRWSLMEYLLGIINNLYF